MVTESENNNILVISPVPTHGHNEGNASRVLNLLSTLQSAGKKIHFLLYDLYGTAIETRKQMAMVWDHYYEVKPSSAVRQSRRGYFDVDDPCEDGLSDKVKKLCEQWDYAICVVNYVWLSKVLESVPNNVLKMIDTHDKFADRQVEAIKNGLNARDAWYYTTKDLEAKGLKRADLVIAIQDDEAKYFESITDGEVKVTTVGHPLVPKYSGSDFQKRLVIGYMASGNDWNVKSCLKLDEALECYDNLRDKCDFIVAGSICRNVRINDCRYIKAIGMVDEISDFYESVDIVLNPMVGGTGLKIKSVEALSFGKVLVSTVDGMTGLPVVHPSQQCKDVHEMLEYIVEFVNDREKLLSVSEDSLAAYQQYCVQQLDAIRSTFSISSGAAVG